MEWKPILAGDPLAPEAVAAVHAIADAVSIGAANRATDLADGDAGIALLLGYLARAEPSRADERAAIASDLLDGAIERMAATTSPDSLFHGFPGVAWVGDHLRMVHGAIDLEVNAAIDDVLADALARSPWSGSWDLVEGLVGVGVYLLERCGFAPADRALAQLIARLSELARRGPDGITFLTAADGSWPDGHWDLGLAHGVPGVIAFLAQVAATDHPSARDARELLDGAVRWLLTRRRADLATTFAAKEAPDRPPRPARSAWCYGDAAIALAIANASRVGDPGWLAAALAIARRAAERPSADTGVRDGTLCHGAAGLAQIYSRLHQLTGDPAMRVAAREWLVHTLSYRATGGELPETAGFFRATQAGDRVPHAGFLVGAAGIGLVLLGAISAVPPAWDRALLLA